MKKNFTTQLIVMALMIALDIILSRFLSINTAYVRISFGFIPIAVNAMLFGPLWAGVCAAIGDVLGAFLVPTGAYFPGFTATAFATGLIMGFFLYKKELPWFKVLLMSIIICIVLNFIIDTLWLYILMGDSVVGMIPLRIVKVAILIPVETAIIYLMKTKVMPRIPLARRFINQ